MRATLEEYSPWVEYFSPSTSYVSAWVQMVDTTTDAWAKSGWIEYPLGVRLALREWRTSGTTHVFDSVPSGGGTSAAYQVDLAGLGTYRMLRNGLSGGMNATVGGYPPNHAQVGGETHTFGDQMPGGILNHMTFSNVNINIGGWVAFAGSAFNSDSSQFDFSGTTTSMDVWDKACAS